MKKVLLYLVVVLSLFLFVSCEEQNKEKNENKNPNTTIINNVEAKKNRVLEISSNAVVNYYNYSSKDNFCFSGTSFYQLVDMVAHSSKNDYSIIKNISNDFPRRINPFEINNQNYYFGNYYQNENGQYVKENAGSFVNKNSVWLNPCDNIDVSELGSLLNGYNADVFAREDFVRYVNNTFSKELGLQYNFDITEELIYLNTLSLSNLWNPFGKLNLTEEKHTFTNSNGETLERQFLKKGAFGVKKEFEEFELFTVFTRDGYKIKFLLPKDGFTLDSIFTYENYLASNNYNQSESWSMESLNEIDYTYCYFPEFNIETTVDVNDFLKVMYNIDNLSVDKLVSNETFTPKLIQKNELNVSENGINGPVVSYDKNHEIVYGSGEDILHRPDIKVNYHEFIVNKSFGFIVTTKDNVAIYSGAVFNI